jgi:hypothetical protein
LKSGEELALLSVTRANSPIVEGRLCTLELLRLLKAEGLKVRMQSESMYGKPKEAISESWVDSDTISDLTTPIMQQVLVPKLTEQLQTTLAQLTPLVDQMKQLHDKTMKRMADLWGLMLLRELYEDPPGFPRDWWLPQKDSPMEPNK